MGRWNRLKFLLREQTIMVHGFQQPWGTLLPQSQTSEKPTSSRVTLTPGMCLLFATSLSAPKPLVAIPRPSQGIWMLLLAETSVHHPPTMAATLVFWP